jgi:hypothetical protein
MRDFRSKRTKSKPGHSNSSCGTRADRGFCFNGLNTDDDTAATVALKDSIAGMLGPMGITGVSFVEPKEITDARSWIQGRENTFMHVTDGTPTGGLCGYIAQNPPPPGAPGCPVCDLLDC